METLTREALTRKTIPDLRHIIRRLGGDSPNTEGKESLVNRIMLFAPQKWKPEVKIKRSPVKWVDEAELRALLKPYLLRGMILEIKNYCWYIKIDSRTDSGSMAMPIAVIERCAKYLMPPNR